MMTKIIEDRIKYYEQGIEKINGIDNISQEKINELKFCLELIKQSDLEKQELINALIDANNYLNTNNETYIGHGSKIHMEFQRLIEKHGSK